MDHVSNLINKPGSCLSSKESSETVTNELQKSTEVARLLTANLWPMMTKLYGHTFTSQFGEQPDEFWAKTLIGITGDEMAQGLKETILRHPKWPPGAAQFRSLCLGDDDRNIDDEGNDATWQHKRMQIADAKQFAEKSGLVDQGAVKRSKERGKITLEELKRKL